MITKILGVFDLIAAIFFCINNLFDRADTWFPNKIIVILGFYLLIKGILFVAFLDFASILDVICAIIIFVSLVMPISPILSLVIVFFLLQKAFFSIFT
jgi:hypothetical protein